MFRNGLREILAFLIYFKKNYTNLLQIKFFLLYLLKNKIIKVMKTFYLYENKRKRYTATYSAAEQILYTVEYRVKKMTIMGKSIYEWREVASVRSMKKFQDIKHFIDAKVSDDMQMKSLSRRVYTNPFLEYVNHDNNIPSNIDWVNN